MRLHRRVVIAAFLVPPITGWAQAQLYLFLLEAPGTERLVSGTIQFPDTSAGDWTDVKLRLRNLGTQAVVLDRFRIKGQGFTLENYPSIPHVIAAGTNVDFRIRFRPAEFGTYSATLIVNDQTYLVVGRCPPSLAVALEEQGQWRLLSSGSTVSFGQVYRGQDARLRFQLQNPTDQTLGVSRVELDSAAFRIAEPLAFPLYVPPHTSFAFTVVFAAERAGVHIGTLRVDERFYRLEAYAIDPPFPTIEFQFDSANYRSGQQGQVRLRLKEPAPVSGTGTLKVELVPDVPLKVADPAVQFLEASRATIPISVGQGEQVIRIGETTSATFQCGTVAGKLRFTAELANRQEQIEFTVSPEPVRLQSGTLERSTIGLRLRVTGFDNTLSASTVTFRFFDRSGAPLPPQNLEVDASQPFQTYFGNTVLGGLFALQAEFPVAGDVSLIGAIEVSLANRVGRSEPYRVQLTR